MPTPSYTKDTVKSSTPGPNFDTKACKSKYPTPKQFEDDSEKFLKAMGMDNSCKTTADSAYEYAYKEQHHSGKAGGFVFPVGGAAASYDGGSTNINQSHEDHKTSEGCSQVMSNVTRQMANTNSITCSLNQTSSRSSTSVSSSASVEIDTSMSPEMLKSVLAELDVMKSTMPKAPIVPPPPDYSAYKDVELLKAGQEAYKLQLEHMAKMFDKSLKSYDTRIKELNASISKARGSLNITGSTIKNYVGGEVGMSKVSVSKSSQAVKEDVKKATKAAVEQNLANNLGVNTNLPSLKSAIDKRVEDNTTSISKSINTTDDQVNVEVKSSSKIVLRTGGSTININDTTFDQHMEVNLKARQLMQNAMDNGKTIAAQLVNEFKDHQDGKSTVAGNEALMKEMNDAIKKSTEGVAKQIQAQAELSKASGEFISDTLGSITSMFSMALLMPLLLLAAPLLLVFVVPMLGFSIPKPLKYLLIAICIYLLVAYFIGLPPFSSKDKYEANMREIEALEKRIHKMLEEFDDNDDGYLSEDEFLSGVKENPELMYDLFDEYQSEFNDGIKHRKKLFRKNKQHEMELLHHDVHLDDKEKMHKLMKSHKHKGKKIGKAYRM